MSANAIAQQFATEFDTPAQQFDMVLFLDGKEARGVAVPESVAEFRLSWQRPKWHALLNKN